MCTSKAILPKNGRKANQVEIQVSFKHVTIRFAVQFVDDWTLRIDFASKSKTE
jgi:hypothetical protein